MKSQEVVNRVSDVSSLATDLRRAYWEFRGGKLSRADAVALTAVASSVNGLVRTERMLLLDALPIRAKTVKRLPPKNRRDR